MNQKVKKRDLAELLKMEIKDLKARLPVILEKRLQIDDVNKALTIQLEKFKEEISNYPTNKFVEMINNGIIEIENKIRNYVTQYDSYAKAVKEYIERDLSIDDIDELKSVLVNSRSALVTMSHTLVSMEGTVDELDVINNYIEILKDITPKEDIPKESISMDFAVFKEEINEELAGLKQFALDVEDIVGTPEWKLSLEKSVLLEKIESNEKSIGNIFKNNRNLIAAISIIFGVMTVAYGGVIGWLITILFRVIEMLSSS